MKRSELQRLVVKYKENKLKFSKRKDIKLKKHLAQLEHRYYHETSRAIKLDLEEIA